MEISKQLKAAILADFVCRYNKQWNENWKIDFCTHCDIVNIYREDCKNYGGHFLGQLVDFCREKFEETPCVGLFQDRLDFYI